MTDLKKLQAFDAEMRKRFGAKWLPAAEWPEDDRTESGPAGGAGGGPRPRHAEEGGELRRGGAVDHHAAGQPVPEAAPAREPAPEPGAPAGPESPEKAGRGGPEGRTPGRAEP